MKPCLKIVGLHVEGLRALRRVDWPADGNGWGDSVPEMVMVGGVNGSGKTTLLDLLNTAARALHSARLRVAHPGARVRVDLVVASRLAGEMRFSCVAGDEAFVQQESSRGPTVLVGERDWAKLSDAPLAFQQVSKLLWGSAQDFMATDFPSVLSLPTDRRLVIPDETYKATGKLDTLLGFDYQFTAPASWKDSLEALLYAARWEDLNAKEEGHPERATHFESYARAFQAFFGDNKRLTWRGGELFVEIADTGALHPLMELSSGEKQALILAAELHRRWRPGSLVLIDEPELHFHSSWQTTLWTLLERLQKERGGQVIVATQSTHLFRIAAPETTVLLGGPLG